ncbi:jg21018 [Pararge aegeria aegeria]|uniref:Jg21018 protein n=1 Tax=Pararge aegeria aegeria TaxID=348720 RepID=A0A8S4QNK4_9NEOP|nr:jg21018 [Pararge aegeria aegeria]
MTKQPCLGRHCFPRSAGEGTRKGVSKKCLTRSYFRGSNHGCLCITQLVVENVTKKCKNNAIKYQTMTFGAWNIRTLLDRDNNMCPERKSAIVARELKRYNVDIAALSETHLADEGKLVEHGGGYTFFWKGTPVSEPRRSGVGFAIKK